MMRARDNPFATERVLRLRYQFEVADGWLQLLNRLHALRYSAAIIGPHGSGKTTLLEDLAGHLQDKGFRTRSLFLNEQNRAYPVELVRRLSHGLTSNDIVLFDGCEQLGPVNWWRFQRQMRRAGGLIVTTHTAGRLPLLWKCQTAPQLLANLVEQLTGPSGCPTESAIRRLYERHNGNLREALRELYDSATQCSHKVTVAQQGPLERNLV
jgi:hypothetical protein